MARFTASSIEFEDGSSLPADVIVFATGFVPNLKDLARELLGADVSRQLSDFWGLDEEGEINGAFRPCGRTYLERALCTVMLSD